MLLLLLGSCEVAAAGGGSGGAEATHHRAHTYHYPSRLPPRVPLYHFIIRINTVGYVLFNLLFILIMHCCKGRQTGGVMEGVGVMVWWWAGVAVLLVLCPSQPASNPAGHVQYTYHV